MDCSKVYTEERYPQLTKKQTEMIHRLRRVERLVTSKDELGALLRMHMRVRSPHKGDTMADLTGWIHEHTGVDLLSRDPSKAMGETEMIPKKYVRCKYQSS